MRLPNGYGTVYKLHGRRRRPWIARRCIGKRIDDTRRRVVTVYLTIGTYATRAEALAALAAYNADPYDPVKRAKTLSEAYEAWAAVHFPTLRETTHYRAAYAVLRPLHDRPLSDIKLDDYEAVLTASQKNAPTLRNVRLLLSQIYAYAAIHEYIPADRKDIPRHIVVGDANPNKLTRRIFTPDEIRALWAAPYTGINPAVLTLLYTGLRVSELCALTPEDVDYDAQTASVRAAKTSAGIRTVPIADGLIDVVRAYMAGPRPSAAVLRASMRTTLGHLPHDCRHTFASLAVERGIDQRIIDAILGHAGANVALRVYTHIDTATMLDAVNRLLDIC